MGTKIPSTSSTAFGTKKTGTKIPPATATAPPSTGLVAWFKGDAGVTVATGVSSWADQSGNGNDVVQATGANQPALTPAVINGIAGVNFNAIGRSLKNTSTSLVTAGAARSVIVVCSPATGTGVFSPGGNLFVFRQSSATFQVIFGTAGGVTYGYSSQVASINLTSPPTLTGVASVVELYSAGTGNAPSFFVNGTSYALSAGNVGTESGTAGFSVGSYLGDTTQFFAGSICEVLVWDHALAAGETTTARKYLQSRFAIALGV